MGSDESRLVIAVTVLSLSISPLWLASARRILRLASSKIDTLDELLHATYGDEVKIVKYSSRRFVFICKMLMNMASDSVSKWTPTTWKNILAASSFLRVQNFYHRLKLQIKQLQTWSSKRPNPRKNNFSGTKTKNQFSPSREKTDTSQKGNSPNA